MYGLIYKNYEEIFGFLLIDKTTIIKLVQQIKIGNEDSFLLLMEINDTIKKISLLCNYQIKFWDALNDYGIFDALEKLIKNLHEAQEKKNEISSSGNKRLMQTEDSAHNGISNFVGKIKQQISGLSKSINDFMNVDDYQKIY